MFGREKAEQADGIGDIKHMFGRERKKTRGSMREQRRFKTCLRRVTMRNHRVKTWRFGSCRNSPLTKAVMAAIN